jgi:phosphinothricin acetyltransferase
MEIRPAASADAEQLAEIYNYYIQNSHATFEIDNVSPVEMAGRIASAGDRYPFYVSESNGIIRGYANCHGWRPRPAYLGSVEISIYLHKDFTKKGAGTELYSRLLAEIFRLGFHTAIAGIALPNDGSVRLHEKFGFEKCAHFREVGSKFGKQIDVGYWQLLLTSPPDQTPGPIKSI